MRTPRAATIPNLPPNSATRDAIRGQVGRGWGARGDRGFVTAWTVALAVACWALVGLALDGGRALRERSEAFGAASSAARAGAQQIDERAAVLGDLQLDEQAARQAALEYVSDRGFGGGSVEIDGLVVTVTIDDSTDLAILQMSVNYNVSATARAVDEADPGGGGGGGPVAAAGDEATSVGGETA
jgi:hypothetical protein